MWRRIPAHFRLHYSELAEKTIVTAEDVNPISRHELNFNHAHVIAVFVLCCVFISNMLSSQVPRTMPQVVNLLPILIVALVQVVLGKYIY